MEEMLSAGMTASINVRSRRLNVKVPQITFHQPPKGSVCLLAFYGLKVSYYYILLHFPNISDIPEIFDNH